MLLERLFVNEDFCDLLAQTITFHILSKSNMFKTNCRLEQMQTGQV